jgi:hypothetical protein
VTAEIQIRRDMGDIADPEVIPVMGKLDPNFLQIFLILSFIRSFVVNIIKRILGLGIFKIDFSPEASTKSPFFQPVRPQADGSRRVIQQLIFLGKVVKVDILLPVHGNGAVSVENVSMPINCYPI